MARRIAIVIALASIWIVAPHAAGRSAQPAQTPAIAVPKTTGTTPSACLQEVRDYTTKRTQEIQATLPTVAPGASQDDMIAAARARSAALQPVTLARTAMLADCVAKFDPKTVAEADLPSLIQLDLDAARIDFSKAAVERLLAIKPASPA